MIVYMNAWWKRMNLWKSSSYRSYSFRLKELLLKERSDRAALQTRLQELEERYRSTLEQLEQVHKREVQHKRMLRSLEDSMTKAEALRVPQRAEEVEHLQSISSVVTDP